MFTVRHIEVTGHEGLYATTRVSYHPKYENLEESVFIDLPDGSTLELVGGSVYVMNETGKTVAVYHFADFVEPK